MPTGTLETTEIQPLTREELRQEALVALKRAASLASTGQEPAQRNALIQIDIARCLTELYRIDTVSHDGYRLHGE